MDSPETAVNASETAGDPAAGPEVALGAENASEGVSAPAEGMPGGDGPDNDGDGGKRRRNPAREAAQYRAELQDTRATLSETETKLADTTARLESMQLELARDVAVRAGLVDGSEFNVPVSEFTDPETGLVDAAKVSTLTTALIKDRPYLGRRTSWDDGRPVSESQLAAMGGKSWSDFLSK